MADFNPFAPHTRARTIDPETSHDAAESVAEKISEKQRAVLDVLSNASYGLTDEEISFALNDMTHSTLRTRRSELAQKGLVFDSRMRRATRSGRMAIVWMV
ncbi:MAG: hypothetical protein GY906_24165 [bacterium]|nr:hypothetical protein [bacterium]